MDLHSIHQGRTPFHTDPHPVPRPRWEQDLLVEELEGPQEVVTRERTVRRLATEPLIGMDLMTMGTKGTGIDGVREILMDLRPAETPMMMMVGRMIVSASS